jgi:hypothetical protein
VNGQPLATTKYLRYDGSTITSSDTPCTSGSG